MSPGRRRLIAVADVVALVAGVGLLFLRSSQPLPIDEAVRRFRAAQTPTPGAEASAGAAPSSPSSEGQALSMRATATPRATTAPSSGAAASLDAEPQLPGEGVYVYATSGWEEVSIPGGRHDYPESTTVTLRHAGCGVIVRWDALVERWDERETCHSAEGEALRAITSSHEFFRHREEVTYRCRPGSLARPVPATAGDGWAGTCDSDDSTATFKGVVLATVCLSVEGRRVETVHIRVESTIAGATSGTNVREAWVVPDTGLLVREISSTDARVRGPFGTVRYQERYELSLSSLAPRT